MRYTNVCVEALAYVLPSRVVTSAAMEKWLRPLYDRLQLPEGRLELMTGIRERRFWPRTAMPSQVSAKAARLALKRARLLATEIECLLHCSVSRDYVEPATATAVHRLLGLPGQALNLDISNACLGVLSGMIMLANMIQLGQVQAGVVVAGEHSLPLVESTIDYLNEAEELSRQQIKPFFASLTIGSAAAAVVLTHESKSRTKHRLLGGAHLANTSYNHLCQGSADTGMTGKSRPMMQTDSEELLLRGVDVARETWQQTKLELGWTDSTPDLVCTHQVGRAHRERMYKALCLDPKSDSSTFEFLGNCGAASLPVTAAMAVEANQVKRGQKLAMLGIGSGINCTMLGLEW